MDEAVAKHEKCVADKKANPKLNCKGLKVKANAATKAYKNAC